MGGQFCETDNFREARGLGSEMCPGLHIGGGLAPQESRSHTSNGLETSHRLSEKSLFEPASTYLNTCFIVVAGL